MAVGGVAASNTTASLAPRTSNAPPRTTIAVSAPVALEENKGVGERSDAAVVDASAVIRPQACHSIGGVVRPPSEFLTSPPPSSLYTSALEENEEETEE